MYVLCIVQHLSPSSYGWPVRTACNDTVHDHDQIMISSMHRSPCLGHHTKRLYFGGKYASRLIWHLLCCRETTSLKLAKLRGCTFVNQYVVIKYLGRGACGRVFLCMDMTDNRLYAVKVGPPNAAYNCCAGCSQCCVKDGSASYSSTVLACICLHYKRYVMLHSAAVQWACQQHKTWLTMLSVTPVGASHMCCSMSDAAATESCQRRVHMQHTCAVFCDACAHCLVQTVFPACITIQPT